MTGSARLLAPVAAVLVVACPRPPANTVDFDALVERYLEQRWASDPEEAARAGVGGYDGRLRDLSPEAIARRLDEEVKLLATLRALNEAMLTSEQRIDRLLIIGGLETSVRRAERLRPWQAEPDLYLPFSAVARLIERASLTLDERAERLATLLDALPALLEQGMANLTNPPRSFTEAALFQTEGTLRFLELEVANFAAQAGARSGALLAANGQAITALKRYETFLREELLPRSNGSWALGREEYDFILKHRWFMTDDADTIRQKGERAFAETEALAQEVAHRLAPGKHWVEVYESLKDDHPRADELKEAYQAQMDRARAFLKENQIVTLPEGERVITVDTPLPLRRSSPFGTFDAPGPFEKDLTGRLVLTPIEETLSPEQRRERLRSHHRAWIPIIAVHEAYPGHHVQALKTNENPRVLRRVIRESIFSEGWGLFTEEMMWEAGFLEGDDVRLTQLRNRLWRAARVVIDVGIHTGTMSFEDGVRFLTEKVRFEPYAAELEVSMYTRRPTMVLGYLIGMMEIQEIRDAYTAKFGRPSKPSEFYDRLLRTGAIPPALVRRELIGDGTPQ